MLVIVLESEYEKVFPDLIDQTTVLTDVVVHHEIVSEEYYSTRVCQGQGG
ncbi:hypothetical protein KOI40_17865 [Aestuariicella sp. G3-2]|nr:hypothetical protein [Aestuariicella albida]MBU3071697.1 hypothetical protein [Aestuariicella albida]